MFRRKKKHEAAAPDAADTAVSEAAPVDPEIGDPEAAEVNDAVAAEELVPVVDDVAPTTQMAPVEASAPGNAAIAFADRNEPVPEFVDDDQAPYNPDSAEAVLRRRRYSPSDGVIVPPHGGQEHLSAGFVVGSVKDVLKKSGTSTPEEREREAAADFQAAIMPGLMGLRDAVPDASTPDEAMRVLAQREAEHEYPHDPEQPTLTGNDIFATDASVYYRIRKRFDRPRRRVGWDNPWRPPPGLAQPDPPHRALNRGK